ncbi:MAG: hypothetical protein AAGA21_17820 [Pseudomonadota bacterium]
MMKRRGPEFAEPDELVVPAGIFGIFRWKDGEALEQVALADGDAVLELDQ